MSARARPSRIGRQAVSYLLAPETIAALRRLSAASGLSMARTIDRAVASLDARRLAPALADAEAACRRALEAIGAPPEE